MDEVNGERPLDGGVEAHETCVGGRRRRSWSWLQEEQGGRLWHGGRDGDVMAHVVANVRRNTLEPIIRENVASGSTVHTDEGRQ